VDVLLEERQVADMRRNTIVSTFMRTLDEYQGILILTTNRVGTFDEALRSRLQLALHFPSLGKDERRKIWCRFINQLGRRGENINEDKLLNRLDELAKFILNGRQIRNAVGTAMRLARHQKAELDFSHIEAVIYVGSNVEDYKKRIFGYNNEESARAYRLR
jgi:SpoVK/Ycf46/Vps4 family AAA+-type ATPase